MNKFMAIFLVCFLVFTVTGCSQNKELVSSLLIHNDGRVDERITGVLDKDYYNEVNLQEWINLEIEEYNADNADSLITFDSLQITDGIVWLSIKYPTVDAYTRFNKEVLFFGTFEEARGAGFSFKGTFTNKESESIVFAEKDLEQFAGKKVLIVEEPIRVIVPATVSFWSEDVTLVGNKKFDMNTIENDDYAILIFE